MLPGSEREKANIDRKKKKEEEAVGGSEKKQKKGSSEERRHSTHLFHLYLPPSSLKTKTQDCKSPDVKLTNDADSKHGHLSFRGKGEGADPEAHEYGLDLNLFAAIDVEGSKVATSDRGVVLVVAKADKDAEEHWPRLLKASGKAPSNIVSVFFLGGGGGFDMAALQSMMAAGGGGGDDDFGGEEEDDDDEGGEGEGGDAAASADEPAPAAAAGKGDSVAVEAAAEAAVSEK